MSNNEQICYNCNSSESQLFLEENGFNLVKCDGCGILYINNPPTGGEIEVATTTGIHDGEKQLDVNVRYRKSADRLYRKVLPKLFPDGFSDINTWLDVGCGYGEFLETLQNYSRDSVELFGSEPNIIKQQAAQKMGMNVSYYDLDEHDTKYDVVSLLNVYSHLPNPFDFIKSLRNVVSPGGFLLIQTGDITSVTRESLIKPAGLPDHLSFATESALISMLDRVGFDIESVVKIPSIAFTLDQVAKEVVKLILPNKSSFLKYYFLPKKTQSQSMFVLAKLR